ncbi:MAG: OmpH family outer membrane protein [candidate division Zixibacteria bacterium]|nr:OmpH family outer membrane protein [candidate division Zixibacteria bacterium]
MIGIKRISFGLAIVGLIMLWSCGSNVEAQGLKIGYVQDDRIYQEYEAWANAQKDWELERKSWEEEASDKQEELQEIKSEYEKQKLILSDEKKREREAAIRTKEEALDAFTRQVYGPGGTAEKKQDQLIQPLLDKISRAIETVAIENNYDVIFTLQGIGYIKESYDVTDKVLELLNNNELGE